jgi:hypothetical protein
MVNILLESVLESYTLIIVLGCLTLVSISFAFLNFLNYLLKDNTWFCNKLNWHLKPKEIKKGRILQRGICPRCKKNIYRSWDGSWTRNKFEENG